MNPFSENLDKINKIAQNKNQIYSTICKKNYPDVPLIQDFFSGLSVDDREFLLTGIETDEIWDEEED